MWAKQQISHYLQQMQFDLCISLCAIQSTTSGIYSAAIYFTFILYNCLYNPSLILVFVNLAFTLALHKQFINVLYCEPTVQSLLPLTLLTVMTPSWVSLSVEMSNMSMPSPLTMVKYISAFFPMSLSVALILPTGVPDLDDSGTLNW